MSVGRAPLYTCVGVFAVSQLGDHLLAFALVLRSAELNLPAATVLVLIADLVPPMLFGAYAGRLVDRLHLRTVVLVGSCIQAVAALTMALSLDVSARIGLLAVIAFAGLASATGAQVMLGRIGDAAGRQRADALSGFDTTVASSLAPALGGVLYATLGTRGIALVDASTFLVVTVAIALVWREEPDPSAPASRVSSPTVAASTSERLKVATRSGFCLVRKSATLRLAMPLILIVILSTCLESVAGVYYLRGVTHGDALGYGLILATWSAGAVAGSLMTAERLHLGGAMTMLAVGGALVGTGLCVAGSIAAAPLVATAFVVGGVGNGAFNTAIRTVINDGVGSDQRGLAWGTFRAWSSAVIGVGVVAGAPGLFLPARPMVVLSGVLPLLAVGLLVLVRRDRPPISGRARDLMSR